MTLPKTLVFGKPVQAQLRSAPRPKLPIKSSSRALYAAGKACGFTHDLKIVFRINEVSSDQR